jgi:hypothetical protein
VTLDDLRDRVHGYILGLCRTGNAFPVSNLDALTRIVAAGLDITAAVARVALQELMAQGYAHQVGGVLLAYEEACEAPEIPSATACAGILEVSMVGPYSRGSRIVQSRTRPPRRGWRYVYRRRP